MDQSDHNDNHFNGISVVVLEQVKQVLHEGSIRLHLQPQ